MSKLSEFEQWIAIMSIMKTSETMKTLPKDIVDYLLINLRREFAPSLKDDNIEFVNKEINVVAKEVQKACGKSAMKMLGDGDKKEAIKQLASIVGNEKSDIISKLFGIK